MIGPHQFCVRPVRAGTALPSDYIVHIPHEQTMVFCITTNGFRCCRCTWIDGIRASTPSLPETFIRTGRGSQKNGYVRKTVVATVSPVHPSDCSAHLYLYAGYGFHWFRKRESTIRASGRNFGNRSGWVKVRQVAPLTPLSI